MGGVPTKGPGEAKVRLGEGDAAVMGGGGGVQVARRAALTGGLVLGRASQFLFCQKMWIKNQAAPPSQSAFVRKSHLSGPRQRTNTTRGRSPRPGPASLST